MRNYSGIAWASGRYDDDDLDAWPESRGKRGPKSGGRIAGCQSMTGRTGIHWSVYGDQTRGGLFDTLGEKFENLCRRGNERPSYTGQYTQSLGGIHWQEWR